MLFCFRLQINSGDVSIDVGGDTLTASNGEVMEFLVAEEPPVTEPVPKKKDDNTTVIIVVVVVVAVVLIIIIAMGIYVSSRGFR